MSKFSILFPNFNLITFTFRSIFWPGGQALCRYILDGGREKFLAGKRVLDLGCGSGAACLAAIKAGAKKPVYANDIDQVR
jgi:predicted nicotinamide N-methyase